MKAKNIYFLIITCFSFFLFSCRKSSEPSLFNKLDSTATGISFTNQITENEQFNIIEYLYFYNGAGVAAGDINNDGLTDIFFSANQGENKLYLNKGNFKFEDISHKAGITGNSNWKTGVTMADINADGLLDIYVCAVGDYKGFKGKNELFINNGNGTFSEKAREYGLDFSGFSTQASFFDYDHDGDLDMFLLTHSVHSTRSYDKASTRNIPDAKSGDYLFRNDSEVSSKDKTFLPKFTDVTQQSGIYQAVMGYGLGVSVADFNNDGWEDIYVSNDFHEDDYYYLNQKNGSFKEVGKEYFGHTSRFSMGSDAADLNNDGYTDLMTLDMYPEDETVEKSSAGEDPFDIYQYKLSYGYGYQYSRNCLQINQEGKYFSEAANITGLAATDWSWSCLMADYDNDGLKDIFISNGIVRRPNNLDYIKYLSGEGSRQLSDTDLLKLMPEGKYHNYIFKGSKSLHFEDKSFKWGFSVANIANGAAYADLDNDGDLDLITNNINEPAGIYQNQSQELTKHNYLTVKLKGDNLNTFGIGTKVMIKQKGDAQYQQLMPSRGFMSASEPVLHFGLGNNPEIDSVVVIWNNQKTEVKTRVKSNSTLIFDQKNAILKTVLPTEKSTENELFQDLSASSGINFVHRENPYSDFSRETLIPFQLSTEGPALAVGDINHDGFDDLYIGGAKNQAGVLFIQQNGKFIPANSAVFLQDSLAEDVDAEFFDADGDGNQDLYVVSGGNELDGKFEALKDRLYLNDGKGNFRKALNHLPVFYGNKSCVKPFDFDKDGDIDLFIGGRSVGGHYGQIPESYLLINDGKGHFSNQTNTLAPGLSHIGMVTDAFWADFNNDREADLILLGDWMGVRLFEHKNGKLALQKNEISDLHGFWQGLSVADFDKDGDLDFVAGNLGTNNKFIKNPEKSMLRMYVKDIDNSGSPEQILAYNRAENWYSVAGKDELGKQIPSVINKKFTNYHQFAGKTIAEIFDGNELDGAAESEVNTFSSTYFENDGKGHFKAYPLPFEAQLSKVFAITTGDFNHDGNPDIVLGGNLYGASMYQGRYDAGKGLILAGDGKGHFKALPGSQSGFIADGEIRKIKLLQKGKLLLAARNNNSVKIFKANH